MKFMKISEIERSYSTTNNENLIDFNKSFNFILCQKDIPVIYFVVIDAYSLKGRIFYFLTHIDCK